MFHRVAAFWTHRAIKVSLSGKSWLQWKIKCSTEHFIQLVRRHNLLQLYWLNKVLTQRIISKNMLVRRAVIVNNVTSWTIYERKNVEPPCKHQDSFCSRMSLFIWRHLTWHRSFISFKMSALSFRYADSFFHHLIKSKAWTPVGSFQAFNLNKDPFAECT